MTRLIAQRYGGLEHLGQALETSEDMDKSLGEVIWLIALLANQSVQIHNLTHPDNKRPELTAEAVELLTVPADLADYREAIAQALQCGTRRAIMRDPRPKRTNQEKGHLIDSDEAIFTRLTYIGLAHLGLTRTQIELTIFGELLDLVDCWRIETGRAQPKRI